jgi:hypothetical protein
MPEQSPLVISRYDVMFAARTGVTILIDKNPTFDCGVEVPVLFRVSPDNPRDVLITADGRSALLKDLRKDYLDEAIERGVIMLYEMKDDEVVRCTPCSFRKK